MIQIWMYFWTFTFFNVWILLKLKGSHSWEEPDWQIHTETLCTGLYNSLVAWIAAVCMRPRLCLSCHQLCNTRLPCPSTEESSGEHLWDCRPHPWGPKMNSIFTSIPLRGVRFLLRWELGVEKMSAPAPQDCATVTPPPSLSHLSLLQRKKEKAKLASGHKEAWVRGLKKSCGIVSQLGFQRGLREPYLESRPESLSQVARGGLDSGFWVTWWCNIWHQLQHWGRHVIFFVWLQLHFCHISTNRSYFLLILSLFFNQMCLISPIGCQIFTQISASLLWLFSVTANKHQNKSNSCTKTHDLLLWQCKGRATVYTQGLIPSHMTEFVLLYL